MSNENQKPVAPTKDTPANTQATPQQSQGGAKPASDKPAEQQK